MPSNPQEVAKIGPVNIVLYQGDITTVQADAIANAANTSLLGGGGVDGAIHRAAGAALHQECQQLFQQAQKAGEVTCPTGQARLTTGGNLPARYVIHTVGPVWQGGRAQEAELLAACYRNSLALAKEHQLTSVIFPSISTGVFAYPLEQAAVVARDAVCQALQVPGTLQQVGWCLFDQRTYEVYANAWRHANLSQ